MSSDNTVSLSYGLTLVGLPTGKVQAEVSLTHKEQRIYADKVDLARAGVRALLASGLANAAVAAGVIPDLPPEPVEPADRPEIVKIRSKVEEDLAAFRQKQAEAEAEGNAKAAAKARAEFEAANQEWKARWAQAKAAFEEERKHRANAIAPLLSSIKDGLLLLSDKVDVMRAIEREKATTTKKDEDLAQGRPIEFFDLEPWEEPVDGADLLDEVATIIRRYVAMSREAADAAALWTLYAHAFDSFDTSPILAIQSPTMGCGKTTLLRVLEGMTPRGYRAVGFTEATVFRLIARSKPTLLIDEADRARDRVGLIEVINAGLERGGSVPRCVGDDNEVRMFSVWTPKVLAGIGKLAGTVQDRAVVIELQRATEDERSGIVRFRPRSDRPTLERVARKARRWVQDHAEQLATLAQREEAPLGDELDARASEQLWLPLISVADAAGGDWPNVARRAALVLSGGRRGDSGDDDLGVLLLRDLATTFEEDGRHFIPTEDILFSLKRSDERPWKTYGKRREGLDANGLSRRLRLFGVRAVQRRVGERNAVRGYGLDERPDGARNTLRDAIARYGAISAVTPVTDVATNSGTVASAVTAGVTGDNREPAAEPVTPEPPTCEGVEIGVTGVTAQRTPSGGNGSTYPTNGVETEELFGPEVEEDVL